MIVIDVKRRGRLEQVFEAAGLPAGSDERTALFVGAVHAAVKQIDDRNTAIQGAPLAMEWTVDGRWNVPFESVMPGGEIVVYWAGALPLLKELWNFLHQTAPVRQRPAGLAGTPKHRPGAYQASFAFYLNEVQTDGPPEQLLGGDVIRIVNLAPYARALEPGGRVSSQAPNGIMDLAYSVFRRRFSRIGARMELRYRRGEYADHGYLTPVIAIVPRGSRAPTLRSTR